MEFKILAPNGPVLMTPQLHGDARGYFMETFRQNEFEAHCGNFFFVQDNQSKSEGNVLRGLHYQLKHPQGKLVRVIQGQVFDVAVDLRKSSPNFGQTYTAFLSDMDHCIFWVPPGFAHGFFVLSEEAVFVYKCTDYYDPGDDHTLLWNDRHLNVPWPISGRCPILSRKDEAGLPFSECPKFV